MTGMFWNLENRGVFYGKGDGGIFLTQRVYGLKKEIEKRGIRSGTI